MRLVPIVFFLFFLTILIQNKSKNQIKGKSIQLERGFYMPIMPTIIRPKGNGTYEMVSGHRRKKACQLAGVEKLKCIIKKQGD